MWAFGITWRPSFVVCHLLTFHIWIFSSETHQPNELKVSRKHLWKVLSKECTFCYDPLPSMALHRQFLFLIGQFLAHLTQRVMWAILITWRPSSSSVVRRKLFQKSSPLKVLDQWKPNLVWIITRVSSFKIVSGDAVHLPTWPLLLKIEHMVKLQVFGNNSKTVSNIKNLTWGKNDRHIKIYLPCNFEVNLITHLGVIALFSSNL